jgi:hypothetical protein
MAEQAAPLVAGVVDSVTGDVALPERIAPEQVVHAGAHGVGEPTPPK